MKKLVVALLASVSLTIGAFAQGSVADQPPRMQTISPIAFFLTGDEFIDVVGLRLSAWSTCQDMTGVDIGIGGEATNAYGLQAALIRNKVVDRASAVQLAVVKNSAGVLTGAQFALLNEAVVAKGLQLGLINQAGDVRGLQIGLVNTTDIIYGYQIGVINVIKGSALPCFPIINFMLFDE